MAERLIDYTIGLPPNNLDDRTNIVMRNSMPICKITPGVPSFTEGITLFSRRPLFKSESDGKNKGELSYTRLLKNAGYALSSDIHNGYLEVAFQADSFPTDSFTNEYGENFLQSVTDVVSEKAASLMQITGSRSLTGGFKTLTGGLKKSTNPLISGLGTGLEKTQETLTDFVSALPGGKSALNAGSLISSLAAGSRLDFPMLWKSSGFQPSYTMTIRLYNPVPADPDMTDKYIIAPIAALMLLGIPISADGKTYSWPFIHKIEAPGIYNLDPAFISNITVIKGGDQQQISYQQHLGVVDVRIDFGSLFNSILAGRKSDGRPTLHQYLQGMKTQKSGVQNFSTRENLTDAQRLAEAERVQGGYTSITKERAPTVDEITDEEKQNPPSRVSTAVKSVADSIINQIPTGFKISTS